LGPPKSAPLNYEPLGNSNLMSRSIETSDLILEELTTEIGLDDSIPTEINDGYYDSEGDILFLEHLLIEETFSDPTLSGGKTRVMETPSFGFHHMPSPRPAAYSLKEVMYRYYHPYLISADGFDEIKSTRFRCCRHGGSSRHLLVYEVPMIGSGSEPIIGSGKECSGCPCGSL
ncbi:hypothetical protein Tco_1076704, partial [Tanacetum coccineum]